LPFLYRYFGRSLRPSSRGKEAPIQGANRLMKAEADSGCRAVAPQGQLLFGRLRPERHLPHGDVLFGRVPCGRRSS
jgi:hypothetical protein